MNNYCEIKANKNDVKEQTESAPTGLYKHVVLFDCLFNKKVTPLTCKFRFVHWRILELNGNSIRKRRY